MSKELGLQRGYEVLEDNEVREGSWFRLRVVGASVVLNIKARGSQDIENWSFSDRTVIDGPFVEVEKVSGDGNVIMYRQVTP